MYDSNTSVDNVCKNDNNKKDHPDENVSEGTLLLLVFLKTNKHKEWLHSRTFGNLKNWHISYNCRNCQSLTCSCNFML